MSGIAPGHYVLVNKDKQTAIEVTGSGELVVCEQNGTEQQSWEIGIHEESGLHYIKSVKGHSYIGFKVPGPVPEIFSWLNDHCLWDARSDGPNTYVFDHASENGVLYAPMDDDDPDKYLDLLPELEDADDPKSLGLKQWMLLPATH